MTEHCRWVDDPEVPGGRFLVPGCMNRGMLGDEAECHCEKITYTDDADGIERCPCCGQIVSKGDQ